MNTAPLVVLCSLVAGAAGAGLALTLGPSDTRAADDGAADATISDLRSELTGLRSTNEELARRLGELEARGDLAAPARQPVGVDSELFGQLLRENEELLRQLVDGGGAAVLADAEDVTERDLIEAMDILLDDAVDEVTKQELWLELADQGATDDLVAMFEERVARDPNDPEAHVDLAGAYFMKITEVGNSPLAGVYGTKGDQALDAALELDPSHWEARFTKAIGLSFWPDFMGKKPEAITQFETLIDKQQNLPAEPHHAQTYLLLGNLHAQMGNADEAAAVWQSGLDAFPDSEDLAEKLGG